jgi:hypothetical protein
MFKGIKKRVGDTQFGPTSNRKNAIEPRTGALNRLMTNYWADVDHNGGSQAHEFYLSEALYAVGHKRFEGVEKIRAFYARRRQRGNTTTHDLVGNLQVFREAVRRASTIGVMSLYRGDGRPQFQWRKDRGPCGASPAPVSVPVFAPDVSVADAGVAAAGVMSNRVVARCSAGRMTV